MRVLPIVERELRVASRKLTTYLGRTTIALLAIIVGGWLLLVMFRQPSNEIGKALFVALSVVIFIYAPISGIAATADCLSEEKREGTLGLLFLTDLKGYDVVLGKLVAGSLGAIYGMLAVLPILAVSILFGGVTYVEFGRVALTALNILFLALSIGMFSSSVCRDERRAAVMSVLLIVFLTAFPAIARWADAKINGTPESDFYFVFSPWMTCIYAFELPMIQNWFSLSNLITASYSVVLLATACIIVPRSWQEKGRSGKPVGVRKRWFDLTQGTSDVRLAYRRRLLDINSFFWLAARDRFKAKLVWVLLATAAVLWLWGWVHEGNQWLDQGNYIFTAICIHTILKYWFAMEACRRFVEDRRSGAMELLLSTPVRVTDILKGQWQALAQQFLLPVSCMVLIDIVFLIAGMDERHWKDFDYWWLNLCIVGISVFVFDLVTLGWVSMWAGITSQTSNRATAMAVSRVLFLPWLVFAIGTTAFVLLVLENPLIRPYISGLNLPDSTILYVWFLIAVGNNVLWLTLSRKNLHEKFRVMATRRMDVRRPILARFGIKR